MSDDTPELPSTKQALQTMLDYVDGTATSLTKLDRARIAIAWDITGYAMVKFCERLVEESYVQPKRVKELLERVNNIRQHKGFLLDSEIAADEAQTAADVADTITQPKAGTASADEPKPLTLEDLF